MPTVFVVDDEASVRKAIARLLRAEDLEVATFASPDEFLQAHDPSAAGCLLLDIAMPGLDGLALQNALADRRCRLPVIFLTGCADVPMSVAAMKRGAFDFLTKPVRDTELLAAIRKAIEKDQNSREARVAQDQFHGRLAALTPREREVLGHVTAGLLNKQIAALLGTTEKTVKVHRARVMQKMKVASLAQLVRLVERARVDSQ